MPLRLQLIAFDEGVYAAGNKNRAFLVRERFQGWFFNKLTEVSEHNRFFCGLVKEKRRKSSFINNVFVVQCAI